MALRFRIIAQYSVNTKFGDTLKILIAREKMANSVVGFQNAMCQSLRASFMKLFIFHFLLPSISRVLSFRQQGSRLDFESGVAKNFVEPQ